MIGQEAVDRILDALNGLEAEGLSVWGQSCDGCPVQLYAEDEDGTKYGIDLVSDRDADECRWVVSE